MEDFANTEKALLDNLFVSNETQVVKEENGITSVAQKLVIPASSDNSSKAVVSVDVPGKGASVSFPVSMFDSLGVADVVAVVSSVDPTKGFAAGALTDESSGGGGDSSVGEEKEVTRELVSVLSINIVGKDGKPVSVADLPEPIEFSLPNASTPGLLCAWLDESTGVWRTDGVYAQGYTPDGGLICASAHLTFFGAILEGITSTLTCAQTTIFSKESIIEMQRGKWYRGLSGLMLGIVLGTLIGMMLLACMLDLSDAWSGFWKLEYFLIAAGPGGHEIAAMESKSCWRTVCSRANGVGCMAFLVVSLFFTLVGEVGNLRRIVNDLVEHVRGGGGLLAFMTIGVLSKCTLRSAAASCYIFYRDADLLFSGEVEALMLAGLQGIACATEQQDTMVATETMVRGSCPDGHPLKAAKTPIDGCFCDVCKASMPKGTLLWGCRRCDFDQCGACCDLKESKSESKSDPKAESKSNDDADEDEPTPQGLRACPDGPARKEAADSDELSNTEFLVQKVTKKASHMNNADKIFDKLRQTVGTPTPFGGRTFTEEEIEEAWQSVSSKVEEKKEAMAAVRSQKTAEQDEEVDTPTPCKRIAIGKEIEEVDTPRPIDEEIEEALLSNTEFLAQKVTKNASLLNNAQEIFDKLRSTVGTLTSFGRTFTEEEIEEAWLKVSSVLKEKKKAKEAREDKKMHSALKKIIEGTGEVTTQREVLRRQGTKLAMRAKSTVDDDFGGAVETGGRRRSSESGEEAGVLLAEERFVRLQDLRTDLLEHQRKHVVRHSSWCAAFKLTLLSWLIHSPLVSLFSRSITISRSMRTLLFTADFLGHCMLCCMFLQHTGSALNKNSSPKCSQQCNLMHALEGKDTEVCIAQHIGRLIAMATMSLICTRIVVIIMSLLHSRDFTVVDYVGSPSWRRKIRWWRLLDALVWIIGLIWCLFAFTFVCLFFSNVAEPDQAKWALTAGLGVFEEWLVIPMAISCVLGLMMMGFVGLLSLRYGVRKHDYMSLGSIDNLRRIFSSANDRRGIQRKLGKKYLDDCRESLSKKKSRTKCFEEFEDIVPGESRLSRSEEPDDTTPMTRVVLGARRHDSEDLSPQEQVLMVEDVEFEDVEFEPASEQHAVAIASSPQQQEELMVEDLEFELASEQDAVVIACTEEMARR